MKKKLFFFLSILLVFGIVAFSTSCDLFPSNPTPPGPGPGPGPEPEEPYVPPVGPILPVGPNVPGIANQTPDGFIYIETATAVSIVGYAGTSKNVTIPAQINGKPVTTIGESAFFQKQLTGVTIPSGVTTIGDHAFRENQLTSVSIPDSVTTIGKVAFYKNQLTGVVTIPSGITTIEEGILPTTN